MSESKTQMTNFVFPLQNLVLRDFLGSKIDPRSGRDLTGYVMCSLILHGRRSIELHKWRNFSVSVKLLQNVFSAFSNSFSTVASAAADVSLIDSQKGKNFTVSYLVDSLGLPKKLAESISKKFRFEDKANPDSVLSLLRSHGFTVSQISSIITDYP